MGVWEKFLNSSEVRILMYLSREKEARYSKLKELVNSRATLDWALRALLKKELVRRTIVDTHPIQTTYSLTPKGEQVVKHLAELTKIVLEE
ncbi:MAG: winged helix-turn-helix transcriptional regulator [Thermoproteota archaeon]